MPPISYISYEDLSKYIHKAEKVIRDKDKYLIDFYDAELKDNPAFIKDIKALMKKNAMFMLNHTGISDPPSFSDILTYVYMMPWGKIGTEEDVPLIPHFEENKIWQKWFRKNFYNRKGYYGNTDTKDGCTFVGSFNLTEFIRQSTLGKVVLLEEEETEKEIISRIFKWSAVVTPNYPYIGGCPLIQYPLIHTISVAKKRTFFLCDLGISLFSNLQYIELDSEEEEDIPILFPDELFDTRSIGFGKVDVTPDVVFNSDSSNLELSSEKFHTIFDMISLAGELTGIEDEDQRYKRIKNAILSIKSENRKFESLTTKDLTALSNMMRLYYQEKDDDNVLRTSLGELLDNTMTDISSDHLLIHKKENMIEMLNIIRKWSSYTLSIGKKGRLTILSYYIGSQNPLEDRNISIFSNQPGSSMPLIEREDDELEHMDYNELSKIPIRISFDSILLDSMHENIMSKQFAEYYFKLGNDTNAKTIYAYIEKKRKEEVYPDSVVMYHDDICDTFPGIKKGRILSTFEKSLDKLITVGAISGYNRNDGGAFFKVVFIK